MACQIAYQAGRRSF